MPGLLRGVARTAVVAGTATAVSNRVSRRQQGRWAEQAAEQQPAPPPPPPPSQADEMTGKIDQLKQLGDLKAQGILTDAEFEEQKRRLLA
ncbi:SHOCT domain-containing protein [Streptomyces sp. T028]|uniref:SHOCT domain-containing protein n=1 Tax=Streptomyces sp. T028 TaxID=3394379 RepID=UPI003A835A47